MVEEGGHLWNSGMFLMRADKVLAELGRFEPELLERTRTAFEAAAGGAIDRDAFARVPSMPIDKAVMERCAEIAVVPCDPRWSDVGSWQALWEIMDKDAASNAIQGDVLLENSGGNLVKADGRLVALAGVHDLAVVETGDAVLVADKRDSEAIKTLVGRLAAAGRREADLHTRELRPWGSFTVLRRDAGFMVREVTLDAGAAIGPQRHAGRAEHWTVVRGRARVTVDGTETLLEPGGTRSVRADTEHRLENAGDVPLQLIEVRTGEEVDDV